MNSMESEIDIDTYVLIFEMKINCMGKRRGFVQQERKRERKGERERGRQRKRERERGEGKGNNAIKK